MQKRCGKRPDKRSSQFPAGERLCGQHRAGLVLRNIPARRYRLRRLIRLPTHNPGGMGGILLPGAIFNTKTKRMVEVYGGLIFSGKPQGSAEENVAGHIPRSALPMPCLNASGATNSAPTKTGFQYADEAFQLSIFLPYPGLRGG